MLVVWQPADRYRAHFHLAIRHCPAQGVHDVGPNDEGNAVAPRMGTRSKDVSCGWETGMIFRFIAVPPRKWKWVEVGTAMMPDMG